MEVIETIKAHPVPIAIGVGVLLLLMARGNSGGSSNAGYYLQAQKMAADTDVAMAQINANAAVQRSAQNLDAYKASLSANAQDAAIRTNLAASIFDTQTKTSAQLEAKAYDNATARMIANGQSDLQLKLASIASADNNAKMYQDFTLGKMAIDSGTAQAMQRMQTDIVLNNQNNNAKLNALAATTSAQLLGLDKTLSANASTEDKYGALQRYQIDATTANLPTILQNAQEMAKISGSNALAIAGVTSSTAQAIASINTQAARTVADAQAHKTNVETNTGILKTILSVFGF